jgi:dihydrofolate reductase
MISIIAAMAKNRSVGNKGKIPWHITEDYIRFSKITKGHPVIMGQKTFESISGFSNFEGWNEKAKQEVKLLPDRTNIILTDESLNIPGAIMANSIEDAIKKAEQGEGSEEIFFIGGASVFNQTINLADKIYLTVIDEEVEGDTYFPEINLSQWNEVESKRRKVQVLDKEINYYFKVFKRK